MTRPARTRTPTRVIVIGFLASFAIAVGVGATTRGFLGLVLVAAAFTILFGIWGLVRLLMTGAKPGTPVRLVDDSGRAVASPGTAGELERLVELHRSGALSDAEFERAKARVLGG